MSNFVALYVSDCKSKHISQNLVLGGDALLELVPLFCSLEGHMVVCSWFKAMKKKVGTRRIGWKHKDAGETTTACS